MTTYLGQSRALPPLFCLSSSPFRLKGWHVEKQVEKEARVQECIFAVFTKEYHVHIEKKT